MSEYSSNALEAISVYFSKSFLSNKPTMSSIDLSSSVSVHCRFPENFVSANILKLGKLFVGTWTPVIVVIAQFSSALKISDAQSTPIPRVSLVLGIFSSFCNRKKVAPQRFFSFILFSGSCFPRRLKYFLLHSKKVALCCSL